MRGDVPSPQWQLRVWTLLIYAKREPQGHNTRRCLSGKPDLIFIFMFGIFIGFYSTFVVVIVKYSCKYLQFSILRH